MSVGRVNRRCAPESATTSGCRRRTGAAPTLVSLFDPVALDRAMAGHGALATHIPVGSAAIRARSWREDDRIRTEVSRNSSTPSCGTTCNASCRRPSPSSVRAAETAGSPRRPCLHRTPVPKPLRWRPPRRPRDSARGAVRAWCSGPDSSPARTRSAGTSSLACGPGSRSFWAGPTAGCPRCTPRCRNRRCGRAGLPGRDLPRLRAAGSQIRMGLCNRGRSRTPFGEVLPDPRPEARRALRRAAQPVAARGQWRSHRGDGLEAGAPEHAGRLGRRPRVNATRCRAAPRR